jgi:hypothetical protein
MPVSRAKPIARRVVRRVFAVRAGTELYACSRHTFAEAGCDFQFTSRFGNHVRQRGGSRLERADRRALRRLGHRLRRLLTSAVADVCGPDGGEAQARRGAGFGGSSCCRWPTERARLAPLGAHARGLRGRRGSPTPRPVGGRGSSAACDYADPLTATRAQPERAAAAPRV